MPLPYTYSVTKQTEILIRPFILNCIYGIGLCHYCLSIGKNIFTGYIVIFIERTVEAGIKHHKACIGIELLEVFQMNVK